MRAQRIVIAGGSGHLGTLLARAFHHDGHDVIVLSRRRRRPSLTPWPTAVWDGRTLGPWASLIDGADVVINLAGRSVNCRYTAANRRQIVESRLESTRVIGKAIAAAAHPPRVWLQMSTATIYAHTFETANDEHRGSIGGNEADAPPQWKFSIDVAQSWEAALNAALVPKTRKVLLRTAMVMSTEEGGTFALLRRLARLGLAGAMSGGRQWMSWIHQDDFVRAVAFLIERDDIDGAVNLAAPAPLPNGEFMAALRRACGMPVGLPHAKPLLEVAAWLMRTETELILKSRRVLPTRLIESGFTFRWPSWPDAARELCRLRRSGAASTVEVW